MKTRPRGAPDTLQRPLLPLMPLLLAFALAALLAVAGRAVAASNPLDAVLSQSRSMSGGDDFLHPDMAFRLAARADGPDRVRIVWEIADGYYLYRSRMGVATPSAEATLGELVLPTGESHTDEYFGTQEIYHGEVIATLPVSRAGGEPLTLPLDISFQGCAHAGLCYPPTTKRLDIELPAAGAAGAIGAVGGSGGAGLVAGAGGTAASGETGGDAAGFVSEQDRLASVIATGNLALVLATFFGLGLLLAFTPCVLPMVPILSGIIAGQGPDVTTRRAFLLSLAYVLGMAVTYTLAGALFAAAGQQVQAVFQQPWIVTLFALFFVALALSMFGLYTIQVPAAIQTRLANVSNRQRAGTFGGVAVMGALSALIVTTCVAPPLIATFIVIGQSGDFVRGSAALFSMSLGMGAPLLAVGASAGKLLPKAGPWMDTVKKLFGVMLVGVAVWMVARIVSGPIALALWAVTALLGAWVLWTAVRSVAGAGWVVRGGAVATGLYGIVLLAGAALGGSDPLSPVPQLAETHEELPFRTIKSVADLEREVTAASAAGQPVVVDFYADWCVSCKEMEKHTFPEQDVRTALAPAVLLRADVTRNDAEDQALLEHFGIFGPPTIAFYGADGEERRNYRVVGFMKPQQFASVATQAMR